MALQKMLDSVFAHNFNKEDQEETKMILSDRDLKILLNSKILEIQPMDLSQIGPTSIDLRLGSTLVKYGCDRIELGKPIAKSEEIEIEMNPNKGYTLIPGDFVLGCTLEKVLMPNGYMGFIETKGNIARAGIQVHNVDGHIDPGTNHNITLEIKNNNSIPIVLYPKIFICQIFVHCLSSLCEKPYNGKYLGQKKPTVYIP